MSNNKKSTPGKKLPSDTDKTNANKQTQQGISSSLTLSSSEPKITTGKPDNSSDKANVTPEKKDDKQTKKTGAVNNKTVVEKPKDKNNKSTLVAITALIISLIIAAGSGFSFYWQQQQQATFQANLLEKSKSIAFDNEKNIRQLLSDSEQETQQKLQLLAKRIPTDKAEQINELAASIEQLRLTDPSDWLIHEANYLVRIASRTLWLEHNTSTAIVLLKEADARLQSINDPELLSVRKYIHQDIEQLNLIPPLQTETVILKIMGLEQQVSTLTLAMVYLPETDELAQPFELSDNIDDWQENALKSWQKFLDNFITINRRTGNVEPLMTPTQQQNLYENLRLKLQVLQWAVSAEKESLYLATLTDIDLWLSEYFDMDKSYNQQFQAAVKALKDEKISFDHKIHLTSLKALAEQIKSKESKYSNNANNLKEASNNSSADAAEATKEEEPSAEDINNLQPSEQGDVL